MRDNNEQLKNRGRENQAKGIGEKIKGRAKDATGSALGDREMEIEGKADEVRGEIRKRTGEAQRDIARDREHRH